MNRTIKSVALALALLSPASVFALSSDAAPSGAEHRHHRGGGGRHFIEKISAHAQELGISQATLDSMKATFEAARPEMERLHQEVRQAHESGDQAKITAAHAAMKQRREALRAKIDGMLTEKQRTAIKELVGKGHPRRDRKQPAPSST
jgi:Spy/CpxP family protein refolding chaperone